MRIMMEPGMESIRNTGPMKNQNHNLVHSLSATLDSAARYELYGQDAQEMGCESCEQLWSKLKNSDQEQLELLRQEIKNHVQNDAFD